MQRVSVRARLADEMIALDKSKIGKHGEPRDGLLDLYNDTSHNYNQTSKVRLI